MRMSDKKLEEINVGFYGFGYDLQNNLKQIFKNGSLINLTKPDEYEMYILDLSYASKRVYEYLNSVQECPVVVFSKFDDFRSKAPCLDMGKYIRFNYNEAENTELLGDKVKKYIQRFEMGCGSQLNEESEKTIEQKEREIWDNWKKTCIYQGL